MSIVFYGKSAVEFWRSGHPIALGLPKASQIQQVPGLKSGHVSQRTLDFKRYGILHSPAHILVPDAVSRRNSNAVHCHLMREPLPSGSFVRIEDGTYVASPELCFLQMARTLPLPRLIVLGMEFCGGYAESEINDDKYYGRKPLTTPARLSSYIARITRIHGVKKARKALRYITADSRSPKESELHTLLRLSRHMGGFGFPPDEMNHEILLSSSICKTSNKHSYIVDLFWKHGKLCLEYNSDLFHDDPTSRADDSEKQATLESIGYIVIGVTWDQLRSTRRFMAIARILARYLGVRLRFKKKEFAEKHQKLRSVLFSNKKEV